MKFGRNVQVNTHRLTYIMTLHFQDGNHNVIKCRKVLQPGE